MATESRATQTTSNINITSIFRRAGCLDVYRTMPNISASSVWVLLRKPVCVSVSVCSRLSFLCQAPVTYSDFTLHWISRFDSNPIYLSSWLFSFSGLLSYLTITVHVIVHYVVLSLRLQHAAARSGVSSCLMLLSLDVFLPAPLHRTTLDIVSVRAERVVDQNQRLNGHLTRW